MQILQQEKCRFFKILKRLSGKGKKRLKTFLKKVIKLQIVLPGVMSCRGPSGPLLAGHAVAGWLRQQALVLLTGAAVLGVDEQQRRLRVMSDDAADRGERLATHTHTHGQFDGVVALLQGSGSLGALPPGL